jgi:catechol 2,3-dioxygenase-like lactoylglutathione lyase family enzyme
VYVDDQEKALRFYIEVLGFVKKADHSPAVSQRGQ